MDPPPPSSADGRRVYVTAFGEPRCSCADGQYIDTAGQCRSIYSSDGCPYHQQLTFNYAFKLQCQPAVCPPERPVPFQGWCKNFGDVSGAEVRWMWKRKGWIRRNSMSLQSCKKSHHQRMSLVETLRG